MAHQSHQKMQEKKHSFFGVCFTWKEICLKKSFPKTLEYEPKENQRDKLDGQDTEIKLDASVGDQSPKGRFSECLLLKALAP